MNATSVKLAHPVHDFLQPQHPAAQPNQLYCIHFDTCVAEWIEHKKFGNFAEVFSEFSVQHQQMAAAFTYGVAGFTNEAVAAFEAVAKAQRNAELTAFAKLHLLVARSVSENLDMQAFVQAARSFHASANRDKEVAAISAAIDQDMVNRASPIEKDLLLLLHGIVLLQTSEYEGASKPIDHVLCEGSTDYLKGRTAVLKLALFALVNPKLYDFDEMLSLAQDLLFPKLDKGEQSRLISAPMLPITQFHAAETDLSSAEEEIARLKVERQALDIRIREREEKHRLDSMSALAASIFEDDWKPDDTPTAETLTAKFQAKAGQPLDDDDKKKEILKLTQFFRRGKGHVIKFEGQNCVLDFDAKGHQLRYLEPGKHPRTYINGTVNWPNLTFESK